MSASDGNRIRLRGDLNASRAREWFDRAPRFNHGETHIDLAELGDADSAGLALLLHWANCINASGGSAVFENAPPQLLRMAKISELEDLFAPRKENERGG